jgi:peptide/nickel transport system permease protein
MNLLPFRFELLWTDALVWVLVAAVIGYAVYARARPHLRAPWSRVSRSASGMAAAVILAAFVLAGLLDSIHYRPALPPQDGKAAYATELRSLLDLTLQPLRDKREKTYSAPLATHLYAKETVLLPDGREVREFPRLRHGGAHLKNPAADWAGDVALRGFRGLAVALLIWFSVA